MTTVQQTRSSRTGRSLFPAAGAAGAAALALMLIGTYLDTPFKNYGSGEWAFGDEHDLVELPLLVAFAVAGAGVVFGVVVPRGLRAAPDRAARRALVVAVAAVVSGIVFWTGLPVVLAAGAATLAFDARKRLGRLPRTAAVAVALAVLMTLAAVWAAFAG
jgi:hypothetical protein